MPRDAAAAARRAMLCRGAIYFYAAADDAAMMPVLSYAAYGLAIITLAPPPRAP